MLEGRYVVITAGAEPVKLPIEGFEHLTTSDEFLELEALPERILFVGGGYIAFEFAHIASRAGAKVTILHRGEQPLEKFDPELVAWLVERTRDLGVDVRVGHEVTAITKGASGFTIHAKTGEDEERVIADLVVHSAGRVPALEDLDLEAGGIEREGKRIKLNDFLQSVSNDSVYAAGDAAEQGSPLTPVASVDAHAVAENLLNGNQVKPDYTGTPSVVFTTPPLAKAGLLEKEACEQGLEFEVKSQKTSDWFTARHTGESCTGFKVLIEKATGRILGAYLIGPGAEEVINLFAVAIQAKLTASELKRSILAFPTASHDIGYML